MKTEVVNAINAMKEKAATLNGTPQNSVCDVTAQCSTYVSPKFTCMKKTIRGVRQKENGYSIALTSFYTTVGHRMNAF